MTSRIAAPFMAAALSALSIASFVSGAATAAEHTPAAKKKPNVLVLFFDDMRFDTFSYRGGPVPTPNIDKLASESVRFNNAMTTTGLCTPSRAALFTGRWGHKTGMDDNVELYHSRLSEMSMNEQTILRQAKNAGYFVGYVGKWHLGAQGAALRGAEFVGRHHEHHEARHRRPFTPFNKVKQVEGYYEGKLDKNQEKHEYYQTLPGTYHDTQAYKKVEDGMKMLEMASKDDRPFFGVIGFNQPHPQYRVPEPYASMFNPAEIELPANFGVQRKNKPLAQSGIWWPWHDVGHMTEADWRKAHAYYYGAMAMVDQIVGDLLNKAKEVGMYDDLNIILLGDQGSMLGEHNLYDKGPYAYDELMRMPLLIRTPDSKPKTVKRQVSMIDLTPTMYEIMGVQPDGEMDGYSLVPLLKIGDKAKIDRPDTALYAYEWYNGSWFGIRAIRTPEMKFVWNPGESLDELYDLKNDPMEMNNLIKVKGYKPKLAKLVKQLESELVRIKDPSVEKLRYNYKQFLMKKKK